MKRNINFLLIITIFLINGLSFINASDCENSCKMMEQLATESQQKCGYNCMRWNSQANKCFGAPSNNCGDFQNMDKCINDCKQQKLQMCIKGCDKNEAAAIEACNVYGKNSPSCKPFNKEECTRNCGQQ